VPCCIVYELNATLISLDSLWLFFSACQDMAYTHYKRLKCELEPLDADNAEHLMVCFQMVLYQAFNHIAMPTHFGSLIRLSLCLGLLSQCN